MTSARPPPPGKVALHYIDVERTAFGDPLVFAAFISEVAWFPSGCVRDSYCHVEYRTAYMPLELTAKPTYIAF